MKKSCVAFLVGLCMFVPMMQCVAGSVRLDFSPVAEVLPFEPEPEGPHRNGALVLYSMRPEARSFDRWVEVLVDASPVDVELADTLLRVMIYDAVGGSLLGQAEAVPQRNRGIINVDMRYESSDAVRLRAELLAGDVLLGAGEMFLSAQPLPVLPEDMRVEVKLDLPENAPDIADYPVTFGVPFPAGALWDVNGLRLVDANGNPIPFQAETTGLWARDGAIKWVRFDALVNSADGCFVEAAAPADTVLPESAVVQVRESEGLVEVDTGAALYVLGPGASPIYEIQVDRQTVVSAADRRGLYVVDNQGRLATAAKDNVFKIESTGPVNACVRFEGFYRTAEGEPLARHITRLEFFAGRAEVHVTHTFIVIHDTNEIWFRDIGWELGVEAGAKPRGIFNIDRVDRRATAEVDIPAGTSVWMMQNDYIQFQGGTQEFTLATTDRRSREQIVHSGAEMGDWAALAGQSGGLLLLCREAARQHPKEIALAPDTVTLRLFSNRAGEELDFRAPALVARWNRGGLIDKSKPIDTDQALELESDATGWSKTHELLFVPLAVASADNIASAMDAALIYSAGLYAHVDPRWIYASRAMGPLYPKDTERFPAVEEFIDTVFDNFIERGHAALNEYGFIDYFAGPHYRSLASGGSPRYHLAYSVRLAAWTLYARAGERILREFAEGTNRRFLDNQISHWPKDTDNILTARIKGLFVGTTHPYYANLPFYWEQRTSPYAGGGPNSINQFIYDYHLTGYRRAGEVAADYAAGIKEWWQPGKPIWYRLKLLRNLTLAYGETWDRGLLPIIEDYLRQVYDPDGAVMVERDGMPHGGITTYKVEEDLQGVIQAAQITGDPRFGKMARRLAEYTVYRSFGTPPLNTRFEKGNAANFLYKATGDMSIVEDAARAVREAPAGRVISGISHASPRLLGLPFLLSLVAEHDADRHPVTSWLYYEEAGTPTVVITQKRDIRDIIDFRLKGVDNLKVKLGGHMPARGFITSYQRDAGMFQLRIPRDAGNTKNFDGPFEFLIQSEGQEERYIVACDRTPLVLFAPGPWRPLPAEQYPQVKIFFQIPPETTQPGMFFEGQARLFDPAGNIWPENAEPLSGWVDLPAETPGLWSFEPVVAGLVEARNIPPFFAFGDPEFYFTPAAIPEIRLEDSGDGDDDDE